MSQIEDIMARAMGASKAWPVVFRAGSAGELASAAIAGLEAAGFVIVPKEATPEMISTAAPLAAHAPGARDFAIALTAVNLLPPNEHPDIADVLAQMAVDYRAMIGARPK